MQNNLKNTWGVILCVLDSLFLVISVFMYMSYQDDKKSIQMMQSAVASFNRSASKIVGNAYKAPKTNIANDPTVKEALNETKNRIWFFSISGVLFAIIGSILISKKEENEPLSW